MRRLGDYLGQKSSLFHLQKFRQPKYLVATNFRYEQRLSKRFLGRADGLS